MANELSKLLFEATRDAVAGIDELYEGYHAELVRSLSRILQILREEASTNAQHREIGELLKQFAAQIQARTEEL